MRKSGGLTDEFDPSSINYHGITAPIGAAELRKFREQMTAFMTRMPPAFDVVRQTARRMRFIIALLLLLNAMPAALLATAVVLIVTGTPPESPGPVGLALSGALSGGVLSWWAARALWRSHRFASPWRRWLRLSRFADDNNFVFSPVSSQPLLSRGVFSRSASALATDRLTCLGKRIELGTLLTGELDGLALPQARGYLAVGLNRVLPHIVLRATANQRGNKGIPGIVRTDQILSLEGNFNTHFTLYAPRAYERDALYIFAPDLMALMIDEASTYDVEIVDDWILFYSPRPFDLESAPALDRLFDLVRVVGTKTLRQTNRYWDTRNGSRFSDNRVAAGGRRLQLKVTLGITAVIVLLLLFQIFRFMH